MRELTLVEHNLIGGGCYDCDDRSALREIMVDSSLIVAPVIGGEIGLAATAGMGLAYSVGGCILGGFAAIVAVPVIAKIGLELAFGVHYVLV